LPHCFVAGLGLLLQSCRRGKENGFSPAHGVFTETLIHTEQVILYISQGKFLDSERDLCGVLQII
jgi:hypothetical protein